MSGSGFSRYARKAIYESGYCYSDSEVLRNIPGFKDQGELDSFEEEVTRLRQMMIEKDGVVSGRFSKSHLCKIHAYIFQDIYSFAGKYRTEDISKGTTQFWRCEYIDVALTKLLNELKNEKYLRGKNKDEFANRAAYYFAELNMIHPFREGNGRALRMFIRQLGLYCGFEIDWSKLTSTEILKAMVDGVDKNYENLQRCIIKSID